MADAHCYLVVEAQNIGASNWTALIALFEAMGMEGSPMPAFNTHWRSRLDGDAVIYESMFDTAEVSITAFKQLLANEFGVEPVDIDHLVGSADYAGIGTSTWQFRYGGLDRFKVERFGGGGASWQESGDEARGYLAANAAGWEPPQSG